MTYIVEYDILILIHELGSLDVSEPCSIVIGKHPCFNGFKG
nr:MAG TPA_asm: hypothetical protein [Bacteriophage sp.]